MNIYTKTGLVIALASSMLVAQVARHYHWEESLSYNIAFFLNAYLFAFPSMDQTAEEHVAHFAKITQSMEAQATEFNAKILGDALYQASFGKNRTQLLELNVPSTTNQDYTIPVLCSAPRVTTSSSSTPPTLPLILYFYGGGLVIGSPKGELLMLRWVAQEANSIVCAVEYRRAPEFPYPIPIQDALEGSIGVLTTQTQLIEKAFGVMLDRSSVGVYGISAGGYMAGHMARRLTELEYPLRCQVMLVPMIKPHGGTPSAMQYWDHRLWGAFKNSYCWSAFLPGDDGTLAADWKVSLLSDPPDSVWSHIPPAYMQIHTKDLLRDEGEMYARKLEKHGKLIALDEFDTSHIGSLPGISNGGPGDGAMAKAVLVLKKYLHE